MAAYPVAGFSLPRVPAAVATALALVGGFAIAALTVISLPLGVGLTAAALTGPLILFDLPAGMAIWLGMRFVAHLDIVSIGPNAIGILVLLTWVGTTGRRQAVQTPLARRHPALVAVLALMLLWMALSIFWSEDAAHAIKGSYRLLPVAGAFLVFATGPTRERSIALIVLGFIAGAVVGVLIGFLSGLHPAAAQVGGQTYVEGRLSGGSGDPNYLAAGLIPAMALACGMIAVRRDAVMRLMLVVAIFVCAAGLVATESRGGVLAGVAALLTALVVSRGHRAQVLGLVAIVVTFVALVAAANPSAMQRITSNKDEGNGRTELWAVALQMTADHSPVGVGIYNFRDRSHEYAQRPGNRKFGYLLTERPELVHNMYLQTLAETGPIGLGLLLAFIVAAMSAAWRAATRFELGGRPAWAALARAVLVAQVGALAASVFLSNMGDDRWWVLLALGPPMLMVASRTSPAPRRAA